MLFSTFDTYGIRYCVLHSAEGLPDKEIASDLDLAVDSSDLGRLHLVFTDLSNSGYHIVQCIEYEVNAYCFVVAWWEDMQLRSLAIDIVSEQWVSGILIPDAVSILVGRRLYRGFWIASPQVEFSYLLAKRTSKGFVSFAQAQRLQLLATEIGKTETLRAAQAIAVGNKATDLANKCMKGDFGPLASINQRMWLVGLIRHPILFCQHAIRNLTRVMRRWRKPNGLLIAFLGPDGAGKSTLLNNVAHVLQDVFRGIDRFHWRPSLLRNRPQVNYDFSHSQTPRGRFASATVLVGVIVDNWLGYLFVIREAIARTRLVLFDRCYWDVLIDPVRYRYGGSRRIAQWLSRLLPRPDIFVVMDAPPGAIFLRKQETSEEELERQRKEYLHFSDKESRAFLIDAALPSDLVCFRCAHMVLQFLIARFRARYPQWTTGA